ncbi:MAG: hypothetical protein ACKO86_22680, partial [Dolichospermum sp.]
MTHPIYTAKYLLKKGISYCKQIAKELGISPNGDKRLVFTWVDAIVEHQAAQVTHQETKVVTATIGFDSDCYEGLTQPYVVLVNGEVVHRTVTYQMAVRHCKWQGYTLLDSQSLAQDELEVELEVQAESAAQSKSAIEVIEQIEDEGFVKLIVQSGENFYAVTPAHPNPKQRCECGDTHFRGSECKHQIAVRNFLASQVQIISPPDFGYYEAVVGDINNTIAIISYHSDRDCDQPWSVRMATKKSEIFASYEEAEQFIKGKYVEDYFAGRGSGRISEPIEDISMSIQDSNFVHDFGQSYTLRVNGVLAGSIFLDE